MSIRLPSTLLLTLLLAVGFVFFLRAASKDRTTVVGVHSPRPAIEVLAGVSDWLHERGWRTRSGDPDRQVLRFEGEVEASVGLALLLSGLAAIGIGCLGLVLRQLLPQLGWWPMLTIALGPLAGAVYRHRAARPEALEIRLMSAGEAQPCSLRLRAHRDELIAIEQHLGARLELTSDGSLLSSPI